ncbi:MAG: DMT family transporter [Thermodesulfobacteriota bacterium]
MTLRRPGPLTKLTVAAVFWGGAFVAGKVALRDVAPEAAAFWRFAIGAGVLAWIWALREGPAALPRTARGWAGLAALGASGVFAYNWFFFKGLALAEAGAAALVITTNPALTALFSAFFLGERLSRARVAGFALAACGALVVLSGGQPDRLLALRLDAGAAWLGAAVLCWVVYVLLGKVVLEGTSPLTATAAAFALGTPLLGLAALGAGELGAALGAPWEAWAALAFMGIFSSALGFLWFYEGVAALGASRASVFIYLVPGFALLFAWFLLGEAVSGPKLVGGALVVAGVALTSWAPASSGQGRPSSARLSRTPGR